MYIQVCTHIGLVHTWVIVSRVCKRVHGRYMWCAPKHISIAITGNFVNGGATDDQCPLTFIYRFYVRFTGHRVVQSAPRFWTRIRGHWCDHQIATQNQRVPDLVLITRDWWFMRFLLVETNWRCVVWVKRTTSTCVWKMKLLDARMGMKIYVEDYCDFINYILKTSFLSIAL